jgi:Mrp family chromosome partitioning ATPase
MIEPINFVGVVLQRWKLIVVLAVVGAAIAVLAPVSTTKHTKTILKWETYASVGAPASSGIIQGTVSNAQIIFYSNTFPVKLAAVSQVGLVGNPYTYSGGMFGTSVGPTKGAYPTGPGSGPATTSKKAVTGGLVTLYAQGPTPTIAANLCNAYAKQLGNTLEGVAAAHVAPTSGPAAKASSASSTDSPFATTSTGYQVVFPGTPELAHRINGVHASQLDSKKVRLIIGVIIGGFLALVIILIRELLNKSIRRPRRAEFHFKFPVIADIPETYPPDSTIVDVVDRPTSPAAEAYRKLRMSVLFESMASDSSAAAGGDPFVEMFGVASSQAEPYQVPAAGSRTVLLVVSTIDESSRPKVVANLAATYAEASEHVIVISTGDLEVGTTFPAESVLSGPLTAADIESRLAPAGPENVSMLSMRHFMRNSGQLVSRSTDVFDAARQVADVIIVEAPAFLRYHHGEAMVHSVDAVIVVAESGVTDAPDAQDMGDILRRLGAPVLGVVFTGEELSSSQRKVLDAGMAASGRGTPVIEVAASEAVDPLDADADDGAVPDAAPELHPS